MTREVQRKKIWSIIQKTRLQVLQEAIEEIFNDKSLLPDGKIRLAWQSFSYIQQKAV